MAKSKAKTEFGDFQTPRDLAQSVCSLLATKDIEVRAIVEPTCGIGNFLVAALEQFPQSEQALGFDVNSSYVRELEARIRHADLRHKVQVTTADFFQTSWKQILSELRDPLLVIGNPPWVTNAQLSVLSSTNVPQKRNIDGLRGYDALTGKSNFDIAEAMLISLFELLSGRNALLAMLCKTSVARKVLARCWKEFDGLGNAELYSIDAVRHFNAAVDACLLYCRFSPGAAQREASVYSSLHAGGATHVIGLRSGKLVADVNLYHRCKHLEGRSEFQWRSGIKHDCSRVMELSEENGRFRNGFGELVDLEPDYLYPLLKGSAVAGGVKEKPPRWMLVTQRTIGGDTAEIAEEAPKTWRYLEQHGAQFDNRRSSIYRGRPRFSVFGVGPYSFAPWKVAISGFYKKLNFSVVGPRNGKPVVLDDTSYFVPCRAQEEAVYISGLLNSEPAKGFLSALVFWDAKRPITTELLRRLDLRLVAREMGTEPTFSEYGGAEMRASIDAQLSLFH